jgi:glutaredoxin
VEALQSRFLAANTQVLGVSVDSIYCHANWAASLGGISFPLLADFNPKGAVAASYGMYLDEAGITDRSTVLIDASGVVRHASSVTPSGRRDIAELAALCESANDSYEETLTPFQPASGIGDDIVLFIKSNCMFSTNAMAALKNLHLEGAVTVHNVSQDAARREQLEQMAGTHQAPCLVVGSKPMHEAADIISYLASKATDLGN